MSANYTIMTLGTAEIDALWAKIKATFAAKATTLAGYGITDASISGETITLGSNTITGITTGTQTFSGAKTFSSTATVKTLTISSTTAEQHIQFSRTGNPNYITVPSGSALHINVAGAAATASSYRFDSTSLRPGTNAAYSLGTSSVLWNVIYGKQLSLGSSSQPLTLNVPIQIWRDLGDNKIQDVTIGFLESNKTAGTQTFCLYSWQATNGTPTGIGYLPMCFGASDAGNNNGLYFTGTGAYSGATNTQYWGIHTNNPLYMLHVNGTFGANTIYENGTAISSLYTYTAGSSIDITNNVVSAKEATTIQSGVVTTAAQSFAGLKTFTNGLTSNTTITVNDTTASTAAIALTGASSKYITVPNGQTLTVSMNGSANANLGFVYSGTYFRPTVSATMYLGGADNRWQGIYGVGLSLTGACAVGTDLTVGGTTTVSGNILPSANTLYLGGSASANRWKGLYTQAITMYGTINSYSIVPRTDNTYNLGSDPKASGKAFKDAYLAGNIHLGNDSQIRMYDNTAATHGYRNVFQLNNADNLVIGYGLAANNIGLTLIYGMKIDMCAGTTKKATIDSSGITSYGGVAAMGIADLSIN